jgi:hypothetical protein
VSILLDTLVQLGFVLAVVLPFALIIAAIMELAGYFSRRLRNGTTRQSRKRDAGQGTAHQPWARSEAKRARHSRPVAHLPR